MKKQRLRRVKEMSAILSSESCRGQFGDEQLLFDAVYSSVMTEVIA